MHDGFYINGVLDNTARTEGITGVGFVLTEVSCGVPMETSTSTALVLCDGLGGYDWSDQAEEGPNRTGAILFLRTISRRSRLKRY
ncbi:hypothetical protein Tco_0637378 [Tanacetum coccineum]